MTVYKAVILAPGPDARLLADLLSETLDPPPAVSTAEVDGSWRVEAYFEEPPEPLALAAIAEGFPRFAAIRDLALERMEDEDWVAKTQAGLHPIEAGRFFVHGSHDRHRARGRRDAIEIDAGQAFGTAHHGTTRGCLILLDRLAKRFAARSVLDLGTGSGVLAIAAARVFNGAVMATDIDPVSIRVAKENFAGNGVANRIRAFAADGLRHSAIVQAGAFDLVMANILAAPLITLAPSIAKAARPGAHLILSGVLDHQAREVCGRYRAQGFILVGRCLLEGWTALHLRRTGGT
jgi:ribosomal protein L11 methyltransferase